MIPKKRNKKSQSLDFFIVGGLVMAFITFIWFVAINTPDTQQEYIGQNQLAILKTSAKAEKALLYIDQAAKIAVVNTLFRIADMGGAFSLDEDSAECGIYYNYYFWQSITDGTMIKCYPEDFEMLAEDFMKSDLDSLISAYTGDELAEFEPNYDIIIKESSIKGIAINPLLLNIVVEKKKEAEEEVPEKPIAPAVGQLRIVIDPGHGAADSGTTGGGYPYQKPYAENKEDIKNKFSAEANKNMYISDVLAEKLRAFGHDVKLTRYGDEFYCEACKTGREARTRYAASQNADIFISIHNNAAGSGASMKSKRLILLPLSSTCESAGTTELCAESKKLAGSIHDSLKETTGADYRVREQGYRGSITPLGVFDQGALSAAKKSSTKVVLMEMAAINDPDLNDPEKVEVMVDSIIKGIFDYAGTVPSAAGGSKPGESLICNYCNDGKENVKAIFGEEAYDECKGNGKTCCQQKCPTDSVVIANLPVYKNQGRDYASLGTCSEGSRTVAKAGCGPVAAHMAFAEAGKDISVESMFCAGGENEMYTPGDGTLVEELYQTVKKHLPDSKLYEKLDFDRIASEIKQGHPVLLDIKQQDLGVREPEEWQNWRGRQTSINERCYETKGHWVNVIGVSENHIIVNDPATGTACSYDKSLGERQVWSKEFVNDVGYYGVALVPEIPEGLQVPTPIDAAAPALQATEGLRLVKTEFKGKEMYKIEVDPAAFDVEIRDTTGGTETNPERKVLAELLGREDVAGINGGFWLSTGQSSSNLVINKHLVSARTEPWFTACFVVKEESGVRKYGIIDEDDFEAEDYIFALCSPWLVKGHQFNFPCDLAVKQTDRDTYCTTENRQRSVLAIKDNGQIDLIAVRNAIVPELGRALASEYKEAIMLDAGGSTSLEYHYKNEDVSIGMETGGKQREIGNAIAVKPRGIAPALPRSEDCRIIQQGEDMPLQTSQPCLSVELIREILEDAKSPVADKAKVFYDLGVKYKIDPAIALAFFRKESNFGKLGTCNDPSESKNPGNIRYYEPYPWRCTYENAYYSPMAQQRGCSLSEENLKDRPYCKYDSWEEGIEAWYVTMTKTPYIADGRTTVDSVFPKYAPSRSYPTDVRKWVNEWRKIQQERGGVPVSDIPSENVLASNKAILNQALLMENLAYNWAGRYGYSFGPDDQKMGYGLDGAGLLYSVGRQLGIISKSTEDKVTFQSCKDIVEKLPGQKFSDKEIRDSNFEVLMPGDLVCARNYGHLGIFFGEKDGKPMLLNAKGVRDLDSGCSDNCCKPESDNKVTLTPIEDYLNEGEYAALRIEPSLVENKPYASDIPPETPTNFVCEGEHSVPNYRRFGGTTTQKEKTEDGKVSTYIVRTIGKYSVNPSFSVDIPFGLGDYDLIKQQVQGYGQNKGILDLVAECERLGTEIESCVAGAVEEVNKRVEMQNSKLEMFNGPCDPEENLWSDFVEDFGDCLDNTEDNCYCEITVDGAAQSDFKDKVNIKADKDGGTKISLEGKEGSLIYEFDNEIGESSKFAIEDGKGKFYLRKEGKSSYLEENVPKTRACSIQKREYKFCVKSENRLPYYDPTKKKTEYKSLEYKFAIEFPDSIPPPAVQGLKAEDKQKAEASIILEFDAPNENGVVVPDINHYLLYCSQTEFEKDDGEPIVAGIKIPQKIGANGREHIKVQASFCGDIRITDNQQYYFAVGAVDTGGNKGPFKEVAAMSVDDLAPGTVGIEAESQSFGFMAQITSSADQITLFWKQPEKNEDGSDLDDFKEYWVYLSETEPDFSMCGAGCIIETSTSAAFPAEIGRNYYAAVAAVDANNNHIASREDFKAPEQWKDLDVSECYVGEDGTAECKGVTEVIEEDPVSREPPDIK